jgi:hypothetical protein
MKSTKSKAPCCVIFSIFPLLFYLS